ncbi:uncharacterized protein LOC128955181 [Oppia nitens]|uniref:uncharacterized protein LOC128955181 n=1 Tax=Oppia nitens TaxID=1686743 RepID=UPI0023DB060C|nr:uncharacterized protein LOC128955181 [Oppia nitens]
MTGRWYPVYSTYKRTFSYMDIDYIADTEPAIFNIIFNDYNPNKKPRIGHTIFDNDNSLLVTYNNKDDDHQQAIYHILGYDPNRYVIIRFESTITNKVGVTVYSRGDGPNQLNLLNIANNILNRLGLNYNLQQTDTNG